MRGVGHSMPQSAVRLRFYGGARDTAQGGCMSRIKWGNVFIALLVLLLGGVGLASVLGMVHLDGLPISGTLSDLGLDIGHTDPTPTPRPRPTLVPTSTRIPAAEPGLPPAATPAL